MHCMKKIIVIIFIFLNFLTINVFAEIKIGIILGFTGPIASLTPPMADSAELAINEANKSGLLLEGKKISLVKADSTCIDTSAASTAAEEIISLGVVAIIGADCPGITQEILEKITKPSGVVMISPAAIDASLTFVNDNNLFFRTTPSATRSMEVLADITKDRKIKNVAITYLNTNDGKKLEDVFRKALKAHDIKVTISIPHEGGKDDYSSEVASLASAGGNAVAIISYPNQGGKGLIQASLDSGAFNKFILSEEMLGKTSIVQMFGKELNNSFGIVAGSKSKNNIMFSKMAKKNEINSSSPFTRESYDAAALIILAIQAGKSAQKDSIAKHILEVANAPGIKIYPGELNKALELLAKDKKINYEGASNLEFFKNGEPFGSFLEKEIRGGKIKTKRQR